MLTARAGLGRWYTGYLPPSCQWRHRSLQQAFKTRLDQRFVARRTSARVALEQHQPIGAPPGCKPLGSVDETPDGTRARPDPISASEGQMGLERTLLDRPAFARQGAVQFASQSLQLLASRSDAQPQGARPCRRWEAAG